MSMLPQPPPNVPAPPPSEAENLSRRKWNWLKGVGIVSILISLLVVLTAPMLIRTRHPHDQVVAVSNARQIGLAMVEFKEEYGAYPNADTAAAVQRATGTTLVLGTKTSNDFFRQLIAGNFVPMERIFYVRIPSAIRPDENIIGAEALKSGECGFTYFLGAKSTDNPKRPLLVTPMIPGTDRFDRKRFDGKVVILRVDDSVSSYPIDKNGHVIIDGRNLMDPNHPIWDGHAPVIAWPE